MVILKYLKCYGMLLSQNLQCLMEYKLDFFLGITTTSLGQVIGIAFIWVIFQRIGDLNGWTLPQIMLIYGIAALPFGLCELFFNGLWKLMFYITMGTFDQYLVKPVDPLLFIIGDESAPHGIGNFLTGVVLIATASRDLNLRWDAINIGFLCLITVCGTLLYVSIYIISATISFWCFGSRASLMFQVHSLRDFSKYPITIYAKPIQILLTWIVPFAFTGFFPATFLLEKTEFSLYVSLIPAVAAVFFSFAYGFWRVGINAYQSTGS